MKPLEFERNLDRMVDAYRDVCRAPLDDTALKRRINRTLRERAATNRQRPWIWLFGLGGMLTASLAGATPAGRQVIAWLQEQLPRVELRQSQPETPAALPPKPAVVVSTKPRLVAETTTPASESVDLAAVPATLRDDVTVVQADISRGSGAGRSGAVSSTSAVPSISAVSPGSAARAKAAANAEGVNSITALYERAYQLQFSQSNYRAALPAWDSYLNAANGGGALVGEARFHRAVCLVALGRYSDARSALTKIANGAGGPAYRARAHTLLQALESASRR